MLEIQGLHSSLLSATCCSATGSHDLDRGRSGSQGHSRRCTVPYSTVHTPVQDRISSEPEQQQGTSMFDVDLHHCRRRIYCPTQPCPARALNGHDDCTTVIEILSNSYWNNHPCPLPFLPRLPRRERSHFGCSSPDPVRQGASNRMDMVGGITLICSELRRATFYDTKP
jgi:hypothetical protein